MSNVLAREPDVTTPAVRTFFRNPGFRIEYGSLAELRPAMVEDDIVIIESLAKRNARARAAQQEYLEIKTDMVPNGFSRSFNLSHCLPYLFAEARRRHPHEEGLVDVLGQAYSEIATPAFPPVQLYDYPIIDAIAARLNKAKQATVFKEDRAEGLAPKTQKANIQRASDIAAEMLPDDPQFVEQVRRVYEALVPATVAVQQSMFNRTYLLSDWDGIGFRDIAGAYPG